MAALKYWDGTQWLLLPTSAIEVNVSPSGPSPRVSELLWVDTDEPDIALSSEVATVLNLRKTSAQALVANQFNNVMGWTVQNAYPTWVAESGTGEFIIPSNGYYRIDFFWMADTTTALKATAIAINGARPVQWNNPGYAQATLGTSPIWYEGNLAAGDKVQFQVYPTATASLKAGSTPDGYEANLWITRAVIRKITFGGIPASGGMPDTPWASPTLLNSWVDYGAPWETAAYRRVAGVTYLRGLIKNGTATDNITIFVLPVGFRPSSDAHFPAVSSTATGAAIIKVLANGNVACGAYANTGYLSLRGLSFPAEQ